MKYIIALIGCGLLWISCKKNETVVIPTVSLTVANASPGISNAKVHTVYTGFNSQITGVNYGASNVYTLPLSSDISLNSSADTATTLYSTIIAAASGTVYSLFLAGANGEDVILQQENLPVYWSHGGVTDSSLGVRFINLSYNSSPVNLTLSTSTTTNEFSNVGYKSLTDFKSYSANAAAPASYTFQVTDAGGTVLASSPALSKNTLRFKNVTLVFKGIIGGSGSTAPSVQVVNHY